MAKHNSPIMLLCFLISCHMMMAPSASDVLQYKPTDNKVLNCDSGTGHNGLKDSKLQLSNFSRTSLMNSKDPDDATASPCIFKTQYNYTVPVSPGPKFIRLHFHPISCRGFNISKALFKVSIAHYTLLVTNSSSYIEANFDSDQYFIKEYCIHIQETMLNMMFTPSSHDDADAFGFVNMIEVVSMPANLYIRDPSIPIVGLSSTFYLANSSSLETTYRLNIGGPYFSPEHDTGMFRSWSTDEDYLSDMTPVLKLKKGISYSSEVPAYTAPENVYTTARSMNKGSLNAWSFWSFRVDSGFHYLIRLHFCETAETSIDGLGNDIVLHIYFGEGHAANYSISLRDKPSVPEYRDYLVNLSRKDQVDEILSISIKENRSALNSNPILNGLEIFKISDHSNSLAGPNPFKARKGIGSSSQILPENRKMKRVVFALMVSLSVVTLLCILPHYLCFLLKRKRISFSQQQSSHNCRQFSLAEIKSATNNFCDSALAGEGGFGKVYKGYIDDGKTAVAIKRASPSSHQGLNEFETEITTLSTLRHLHLVSLIGCCMEGNEMILVYNFMAQGTLRDHLYKAKKAPLPWKQRLMICIGAARGLHYLHTGGNHIIIHRDVKSSNILVDENWVAKIADFGLSKTGKGVMTVSGNTHVSTLVKGSFGYLDPEYYRRQKLTEKSDVYSFGVVLFEAIFARPAVLPMVENEEDHEKANLAEWAIHCHNLGNLEHKIDTFLQGNIHPECFNTFVEIASRCLAEHGSDRPTMGEVVWNLELAWKQQLHSETEANRGRVHDSDGNTMTSNHWSVTIDGKSCFPNGNSDPTPGIEFSELTAQRGR